MKKKMKQSKLTLILNLCSVSLIAVALILVGCTNLISRSADQANEERFELGEYARNMMTASTLLTNEARAFASSGHELHYDNYMQELETNKTREHCIEKMREIGLEQDEQAVLDRMMSISDQLIPLEQQALKDAKDGNFVDASKALLSTSYNDAVTEIGQKKLEFLDLIAKRTSAEVHKLVLLTRAFEGISLLAGIVVIVLQVFSYLILRKRVILPIIAVEEEMHHIAEGDLSSHFDMEADSSEIGMMIDSIHHTKQELRKYIFDISEKLDRMADHDLSLALDMDYIGDFRPIGQSLEQIIHSLNHAFYGFNGSAQQVAQGSGQIADGAQALAQGSATQSAAVDQIAAAIARMRDQITDTAQRSQMASDLACAAGVELDKSNIQLQEMLSAMNEISGASDEIGKIIKTIEDIAFQTNILALNAAVEAARAGTAGKGFAIVAGEVGDLAQKSSEASNQTSEMIENSLEIIQNGAKIASSASNTFTTVMVNAGKAADAMISITKTTQKQAEVITQISDGIDQIVSIVQSNSSSAEESASFSEQLAEQAMRLRTRVEEFTLREDSGEQVLE